MNIVETVVLLRTDIQTRSVGQPPVFNTEMKEGEHSSSKVMEIIIYLLSSKLPIELCSTHLLKM